MVLVATVAVTAEAVLDVTITFTCRQTKSAARPGNRSTSPAAQRYSIARFRPSTYSLFRSGLDGTRANGSQRAQAFVPRGTQ
jgi:hypothetical protein